MISGEWQKALWKIQPYPDNYIPERYFLSSLRKNRKCNDYCQDLSFDRLIVANFRPYTYWPLVLASCAITQHLSSIFIFLAVFARLQDHTLDARILVWVTVGCFFGGYFTWELLEWSHIEHVQRNMNRTHYSTNVYLSLTFKARYQNIEIVDFGVLGSHGTIPSAQDSECRYIFRLYMGTVGVLVCVECITR